MVKMMSRKIKIKIDDLFNILNLNNNDNEQEVSFYNNLDIKIKNHNNTFVNINEFVIKKTDSYVVTFSSCDKIICSNKHIMMTEKGSMKVIDIYNDDINVIKDNSYVKIVSIILNKVDDELYDFCLDFPHLWKDTNNFIHHNSLSMYFLTRFMLMKKMQTIIMVPSIDLVYQMYNDFIDYGWNHISKYVQRIGDKFKDKRFLKPVIITTWQSLNAKRVKFYKQLNKKNSIDINKMKFVNKQINMLLKIL